MSGTVHLVIPGTNSCLQLLSPPPAFAPHLHLGVTSDECCLFHGTDDNVASLVHVDTTSTTFAPHAATLPTE